MLAPLNEKAKKSFRLEMEIQYPRKAARSLSGRFSSQSLEELNWMKLSRSAFVFLHLYGALSKSSEATFNTYQISRKERHQLRQPQMIMKMKILSLLGGRAEAGQVLESEGRLDRNTRAQETRCTNATAPTTQAIQLHD